MKYIACLFLAGCAMTMIPASPEAPPDIGKSVYRLSLGEGAHCTAVVAPGGVYFTAGHCAGFIGPYEMAHPGGVVYEAEPPQAATDADIAVGFTSAPGTTEIALDLPLPGDTVWMTGFGCSPEEVRSMVWTGAERYEKIVTRGMICKGDSGGGVFDNLGLLVAVVSSYDTANQSISYVVPVSEAASLF